MVIARNDEADSGETAETLLGHRQPETSAAWKRIDALYLADETEVVTGLLEQARLEPDAHRRIRERASTLVERVRSAPEQESGLDAFMHQYDLGSQEGVVLMCLAEALLRIPDSDTADKLIQDKLSGADFEAHMSESESLFVNASTWGLMLTGKIVRPPDDGPGFFRRMVRRLGEPVIRSAMRRAMGLMGHQFVMGEDVGQALKRSRSKGHRLYRHSFDMLGEAALTARDAERYFVAYKDAIRAIGEARDPDGDVFEQPSISVKLSALHPRYSFAKRERILKELTPRLLELAEKARKREIALTVDAEEADRLQLSLEVFEAVYRSPTLDGWAGLGLALQAYQKRAYPVIEWLDDLAAEVGRRIPVRLVKGAYWDTEIKRAQQQGLDGYPVFTRKVSTDVSYLACARRLFEAGDRIYPQFATHNAHTVAALLEMSGGRGDFEFQRLHGMGEELYQQVVGPDRLDKACRVYAPVGSHQDLLPYLVRRLLENGANTSFVNRIVDERVPLEEIIADPVEELAAIPSKPHPRIPLPADIYGAGRRNSRGTNLADPLELDRLESGLAEAMEGAWSATPIVAGKALEGGEVLPVFDPSDNRRQIGVKRFADTAAVDRAIDLATHAQPEWDRKPAAQRADILLAAADLYELHSDELIAMCVREAGKTVPDSIAEVREAVDFLRYYADRCRYEFGAPVQLPGPTGESNQLTLHGRGVFLTVSPWNFPLAIYTGQVCAALAAGNAVLAKPAEQTTLVAHRATELLYEAGVPPEVLAFLPGEGPEIGGHALRDPHLAGVAFTGSTETAHIIDRTLAERGGSIPQLIAETGGQNAMLVDSSALPEQVVLDVVQSAFGSAGQRCSALRILCLQEEIAPRVLELLEGYMSELRVGDPMRLASDLGPVIDNEALSILERHADYISKVGRVVHRCELGEGCAHGHYFAPMAVEIDSIASLEREVFGPVLHVVRYRSRDLDRVISALNATGYGLTLGVHSRIEETHRYIHSRMRVGNTYVNRDMVGAVVGVQPFGGQGLSGTGPKAGGPHYLHAFATERTLTVNTAAVGGNASLMSLGED